MVRPELTVTKNRRERERSAAPTEPVQVPRLQTRKRQRR
jgi:hypothetical protein